LPFVFAAWISRRKLEDSFIQAFDEANGVGVNDLQKVLADLHADSIDLNHYYTNNISYLLDDEKRRGMQLFLSKMQIRV
jgi:chorismate dehydratase